ncbi:MAG: family 78 glycoside hydrolase catalytic domain, partial [Pseudobutyrivibrio sp.]|nr:family 78 glycoside hydrolase catalytic domain [Pseudobutyrivibrio sp.]
MSNMENLGKWITNNTDKPFIARRTINISGPVKSAKALVTGLGQFNFYIDGKKISDHVLDPGWTDYRKTIQYVDFDVTEELTAGAHTLEIEVGNGWFCWDQDFGYSFHFPEFMPPNPNPYKAFSDYLICNMRLVVSFMDGSLDEIITDEAWQVKEHRVKHSNVYGSELIGAECGDWQQAALVDSQNIPAGKLTFQSQPAIKVIKTYQGKLISEKDGIRIYDIGQNISGLLRTKVRGKAGEKLIFKPAEKLDENGMPDQMAKNWMLIDTIISYEIETDNQVEEVRQSFTYFAGRYFAVEGVADILELNADAITSAWKTDGSFNCDDDRYNRIYAMIEKTVEANMLSVHTDCP